MKLGKKQVNYGPKTCTLCGAQFKPRSGRQQTCSTLPEDMKYPPMPQVPNRVKAADKDQKRVDLALKLARKASAFPEMSTYVSGLLAWVDAVAAGYPINRYATLALLGHDIVREEPRSEACKS